MEFTAKVLKVAIETTLVKQLAGCVVRIARRRRWDSG
jgi:hypothetical protein